MSAYQEWIERAELTCGPVFRRIDRWGHLSAAALHPNSLVPWLRHLFEEAGIPSPDTYSSHSLRRGFATWANAQGWDVKALMEYVGWKDMKSALRYIEGADPYGRHRVELGLAAAMPPVPATQSAMAGTLELDLVINLERFDARARGLKQAHQLIEQLCLTHYQLQRLDKTGHRYRLTVQAASGDMLDELVDTLLDEMHQIADNHRCFLDVTLHDPITDRTWS